MVVQPFSHAVRLNRGNEDDGTGLLYESFASCFVRDRSLARTRLFNQHGHTGFAWAARREFVTECGLYDACLTGSGDHLMAHAFAAAVAKSPCMPHLIGPSPAYRQHFVRWAVQARDFVGGKLGVVPGRILHLWHGDLGDRQLCPHEPPVHDLRFRPRYAHPGRLGRVVGVERSARTRCGEWAREHVSKPETKTVNGPALPEPVAAAQ